jgi:hypothetical protein
MVDVYIYARETRANMRYFTHLQKYAKPYFSLASNVNMALHFSVRCFEYFEHHVKNFPFPQGCF